MKTTIKLRMPGSTAYYTASDSRERLVRFFNALYNAEGADAVRELVNSMGLRKGRSRSAGEVWTYDLGAPVVKVDRNNYNPDTNNFAHGKSLDQIRLAKVPAAHAGSNTD